MMNINKIKIITSEGSYLMQKDSEGYSYGDVRVSVDNDGYVSVIGCDTAVKFIQIIIDNTYFSNDAVLLGGSWERNYGEYEWKKISDINKAMPWYFFANEGDKTHCFGVETQPNSLCSWNADSNTIVLDIDIRNGNDGLKLNGRCLKACRIIQKSYENDLFEAMQDFFKSMCPNPRLPKTPIYGGNDWYCNYGDSSFEKILKHTHNIVSCSSDLDYKPYMVIDEGWEKYSGYPANSGPWICNDKFGDMKKMAEAIEEAGAIPGIWLRPLTTVEKVPDEHRLRTSGDEVTLDPSSPLTLKIVEEDIKRIVSWGYKLIKHDFSSWDIFGQWGKELDMSVPMDFYDKTKTTAEIIKGFYSVIRSSAGDDVMIIGCNTMSHLSAGFFELQRTGDDTSGLEWERTKKMGINTLAFSLPQHMAFYAIDADCVGITCKIPWDINKKWLDVLAKSGTPLFVSIEDKAFTDEVKSDVSASFKKATENQVVSRPLDWLDNALPTRWQSAYGVDTYEW